jgi:hypothetical protein
MEFSEYSIQKKLFTRFSTHKYRFINIYFFKYNSECDFLSFTQSGYTQEIEIKISRADFKADFKKPKHEMMKIKSDKYANRFYYAVPENLITVDEVPKYAGLIYINKNTVLTIVKKAPLLHKRKHDHLRAFNKMYNAYEETLINRLFPPEKTLF